MHSQEEKMTKRKKRNKDDEKFLQLTLKKTERKRF